MLFNFSFLFLVSITSLPESPPPAAQEQQALGVLIRPPFLTGLAAAISRQSSGLPINICVEDLRLEGSFFPKLGECRWIRSAESPLQMSLPLAFTFRGKIIRGCAQPLRTYSIEISQEVIDLDIELRPEALFVSPPETGGTPVHSISLLRIDPRSRASTSLHPQMTVQSAEGRNEDFRNLGEWIGQETILSLAWNELKSRLEETLTEAISHRFRNFILLRSLSELGGETFLAQEGVIHQKGGLKIEMEAAPLADRKAFLSLTPFRSGGVRMTEAGVQLFANARFLQEDSLRQMHGEEFQQLSLDELKIRSEEKLRDVSQWEVATFRPLQLPSSPASLSLILPISLINQALQTLYREGLLRFKTSLHLGQQTQGILTREAPDVSTVVRVAPLSAPALSFEANRTTLHIVRYLLDLGTEIEDRLIPSSRHLTNASVAANLFLSPTTQTVNLKLDPATFRLSQTDLSGRMTDVQKDVLERMTLGLWQSFLQQYSNLVLFPSVIALEDSEFQVVGIDVNDTTVLLHIDIHWGEIKL